METVRRKIDQFREGRRGFQERTDLGIPMYSRGRRTGGISRGGVGRGAFGADDAPAAGAVGAGAEEPDGVEGGGGVELILSTKVWMVVVQRLSRV